MRRRVRELLSFSYFLHSPGKRNPLSKPAPPPSHNASFQGSTSTFSTSSKSQRDSLLLEQFKQRKLKGSSSKDLKVDTAVTAGEKKVVQKGLQNESEPTMVVANFKELGVSEELVEVMDGIGEFVPSEIQCVVIPAILEGKSVLLSSPSDHDRTLAYLLPLIQLLRRDRELLSSNSKHPRAIVLCASEEKAAQCYNAAQYIIHDAELKSAKNCASATSEQSNSSIGLMIGTPCEVLQYIQEGNVVPAELRYLVLDGMDCLLNSGHSPEIHKILKPLQDHGSTSTVKRLQTILAISTIAEVLGEESPLVKRLERDHAGNISAMSLEMEPTEVFDFSESLEALRKKVAEAMNSLLK
ncbi:DEAD-box ATP-dependent RNA helicase 39-like [Lotus japonicus]|uniref:DEAD-box ATP-dependent RNA helicase 39-like n=1 Tax=Lotus japonicus TaxID=34305 RepID=UPI00258EC147|nr:DEAD-box ATP-dependent RNA helicase 39-like [Lotus japonicus]